MNKNKIFEKIMCILLIVFAFIEILVTVIVLFGMC